MAHLGSDDPRQVVNWIFHLAAHYAVHMRQSPALVSEAATGRLDGLNHLVCDDARLVMDDVLPIFKWFQDNWPSDLLWPRDVPREGGCVMDWVTERPEPALTDRQRVLLSAASLLLIAAMRGAHSEEWQEAVQRLDAAVQMQAGHDLPQDLQGVFVAAGRITDGKMPGMTGVLISDLAYAVTEYLKPRIVDQMIVISREDDCDAPAIEGGV